MKLLLVIECYRHKIHLYTATILNTVAKICRGDSKLTWAVEYPFDLI
jgi:hypothetical protein